MYTNAHIHLFSTDHTPSIQLYHLMRGTLHGAARRLLPTVLGHPMTVADLKNLDRSMDRFEWPWPILFQVASGASSTIGGIGMIDPRRLINMFTTISRMTREDARGILGVDMSEKEGDFLKNLTDKTNINRQAGKLFPFRDTLCDIISELFKAHQNGVKQKGVIGQEELWNVFLQSQGADQYNRVIVLSVNFDEAFLDDDLPGLSSTPGLDFAAQMDDLEKLAKKVNDQGAIKMLPFLCIDPRGHSDSSLETFVLEHVGKTKLWKGLKVYPPMGVLPTDDRFRKIFDFCQDNGIPVTSHCSIGGAGVRGSDRNFADLAHPLKWMDVLVRLEQRNERTGTFRLCLAHFDSLEASDELSWGNDIMNLMTRFDGSKGVEVFSDISFNVIDEKSREKYNDNVKKAKDLGLAPRVLFGSDWWNYLYECETEKEFIDQLDFDQGFWETKDFEPAADSFLQDVV
jgi:predicted TIM-barrel fold metal-dependent hydrolase